MPSSRESWRYSRSHARPRSRTYARGPRPGDAEIEHDVRRLEIAVNDTARVRVRQACENLIDHRPHDGPRQGRRVHPLVNAPPGQHVHHEERTAVRELAEVARAHDSRMIEERDGARFLMKPPAFLGTAFPLVRRPEALERHAVAGHDVAAKVHDAHPAAAELAHDFVPQRQHGADLARRRRPTSLPCRRHCARTGSKSSVLRDPMRRGSLSIAPTALPRPGGHPRKGADRGALGLASRRPAILSRSERSTQALVAAPTFFFAGKV